MNKTHPNEIEVKNNFDFKVNVLRINIKLKKKRKSKGYEKIKKNLNKLKGMKI